MLSPVESAASHAVTLTFDTFRSFFEAIEEKKDIEKHQYQLMIICPDCGKGLAYKGRCPKCGGKSWFPAGSRPAPAVPSH